MNENIDHLFRATGGVVLLSAGWNLVRTGRHLLQTHGETQSTELLPVQMFWMSLGLYTFAGFVLAGIASLTGLYLLRTASHARIAALTPLMLPAVSLICLNGYSLLLDGLAIGMGMLAYALGAPRRELD